MSAARLRLLLVLGLTGVMTFAAAQTKKAPPSTFAVPGSPESMSAGSSAGNTDGRGATRGRRHRSHARADAAVATFPGFRLLPDGRSRIYVELTRTVSVDERRADGMLIYLIHDARVPVRNNRNALITTHFATPVGRARLLAAGADVQLIIDLRKSVSATQKVVAGENGGVRLEVDFPAGDYPPAPGMFEPPAAKGKGARGNEGEGDPGSSEAQGATPPAASAEPSRTASPPAAPAPPAANGKP